jgi:hypothetical protein
VNEYLAASGAGKATAATLTPNSPPYICDRPLPDLRDETPQQGSKVLFHPRPESELDDHRVHGLLPPNLYDSCESITFKLSPLYISFTFCPARFFRNELRNIATPTLVSMFETLVQSLFKNMPHSAANASLQGNKTVGETFLSHARGSDNLTKRDNVIIRDMPLDIRTVHKIFDLGPQLTIYATCPRSKCCAIYSPIDDSPICKITQYPLTCTREKFGRVCGSSLVKQKIINGKSVPVPRRPFPYHHFGDHVAALLSRPDIEDALEEHMCSASFKDEIRDVIHSPVLTDLQDSDGLPFLRRNGTDLKLVWGLGVDWYNPQGNRAAGKSVTLGAISMVCLSLPPALRTREENIYLAGIIPGPQEPSVDATNHFIKPLISELKTAYSPGIRFSRTHKYPTGRTSHHALVPVIADTMASKKVTGHCGHAGTYPCSRCRLPRSEIDNLDVATWPPGLTSAEHRELANSWLHAPTQAKQSAQLKKHGIRWSELLDLDYWRPSEWTITEGMHVVLLRVIPYHCRDLLGLNIDDLADQEPEVSPAMLAKADEKLTNRSISGLKSLSIHVLKALCQKKLVPLPPRGRSRRKKREYISALLVCFKLPMLPSGY